MAHIIDKPIVSADYDFGNTFDSKGNPLDVTCTVKYTDGSIEVFTEPKALTAVGKRLAAQQKVIAERFIETMLYLHSDKETNYDSGSELGLTNDALSAFSRCGYEVAFKIVVDRVTGIAKATHLNDVALTEPVEI